MKLRVQLNGTDKNPYAKWGLKQNPFPQLGDARYDAATLRLQSLGGEPIPHGSAELYIRARLAGFSIEFVDFVVSKFKPGEYVAFEVTFPE